MPKIQLQRYLETSTKRVGVDSSPTKQEHTASILAMVAQKRMVIAIKLDSV